MKKLLSILGAMTLIGTPSTSVIACCGREKPNPPAPDTRTDLTTIITNVELGKIIMLGTTPNAQELLTAIHEDNAGAKHLQLTAFTIVGNASETKATIKGINNYKGEVTLSYEKDTRTDINGKITSPIDLGQLDTNTASEFLIKLQKKLETISGLTNIKTTDYDVYKTNTINQKITDKDITENESLNIKIIASPTSQNFRGSNQNIVVNFQKKLDSVLTNTDLGTINIPQSIIDDSDKSKIECLILSYLKSNNKNEILWTLGIDVSDVQIDKQQNKGTAKVKSNNKNYYTGDVNISFVVSREKIDLNQLVIDQYISSTNADTSKKMKDLYISKILKIFNKIKLISPIIEYQDLNWKNINEENQKKGTFQVKITTDKLDPNYKGTIVISGWKLK